MTPEQRANRAVRRINEARHGAVDWSAIAGINQLREIVADEILTAMMDCRTVCTFIPDKDRIAELVNGERRVPE